MNGRAGADRVVMIVLDTVAKVHAWSFIGFTNLNAGKEYNSLETQRLDGVVSALSRAKLARIPTSSPYVIASLKRSKRNVV